MLRKGVRHTFWPIEGPTDPKFEVYVSPPDKVVGFNESFLRNFNSYLKDCDQHKLEPSPFQLILFLYRADILIAGPLPTPLLVAVHWIAGVLIGHYLLGYADRVCLVFEAKRQPFSYQTSYPEYYTPNRSTSVSTDKSDRKDL